MPITCFYFDVPASVLANNWLIWSEALLQDVAFTLLPKLLDDITMRVNRMK